ncbi:MAG TPA: efflux RND transporter periplasmic adaptor subunit, partial [Candidatus Acidoferrum sp.]|nr:efflux RND transporter periplasmic adaptor subunit [Candidatus Acidoferrum sp.]
ETIWGRRTVAQRPGLKIDLNSLAIELLAAPELVPRARRIARAVGEALPGTFVNVYTAGKFAGEDAWILRASAGGESVGTGHIPLHEGTLGELDAEHVVVFFGGADLSREDYAHLDIRRTLYSLAYVVLQSDGMVTGAIEILSFDAELPRESLDEAGPLAEISSGALNAARSYEAERNDSLVSVSRLTQLYDLERSFSSTLEMDELLPIIGSKFLEVMECSAINLWLLRGDESLELMHQAGEDPTTPPGSIERPGEGIPGDVSDNGEPVLIVDGDDARLRARSASQREGGVSTLLVVPIMDKGALVGVVEAVNKTGAEPFDDDDLFALSTITETASSALHNASLLMAERKVEVLETLVTVSHEITSTLNLERMLQTIVNAPQAVIPYERAAIALEQRGRFKLSAVSGVTQVNADAPAIAPLNSVLQWAALAEEVVHVKQQGEEIDAEREETRAKFKQYFAETGMRGFYAIPLNDDTGRVGILGLESSDPDFLTPVHIELLQVLAGQATVALRNAQMYKEVPFISVLEPVLERKRRFMALEKTRRRLFTVLAIAAAGFLAIFPLPMRLAGDAVVAPGRRAQLQPEFEGVVGKVLVREGEPVKRGQVLAEMESWDRQTALAAAEARYQTALLQMNHALASNDGAEAGIQRVQADYWKAEVASARQLLDRAALRSPIDGVVATPHVDTFVGRRLQFGETLAEVVDASSAVVDVAVDEADVSLLRAGQKAAVKLNGYPTRTFRGTVTTISPKAEAQGDSRVFFARVALDNPEGLIRSGMEGRGKISAGWKMSGYVLFRRPAIWLYSRVWNWFGW